MSGSGISWAICKSAPRSRQITTPAPHRSSFLQAGCPSCRPTNSVKALKALETMMPLMTVNSDQRSYRPYDFLLAFHSEVTYSEVDVVINARYTYRSSQQRLWETDCNIAVNIWLPISVIHWTEHRCWLTLKTISSLMPGTRIVPPNSACERLTVTSECRSAPSRRIDQFFATWHMHSHSPIGCYF